MLSFNMKARGYRIKQLFLGVLLFLTPAYAQTNSFEIEVIRMGIAGSVLFLIVLLMLHD